MIFHPERFKPEQFKPGVHHLELMTTLWVKMSKAIRLPFLNVHVKETDYRKPPSPQSWIDFQAGICPGRRRKVHPKCSDGTWWWWHSGFKCASYVEVVIYIDGTEFEKITPSSSELSTVKNYSIPASVYNWQKGKERYAKNQYLCIDPKSNSHHYSTSPVKQAVATLPACCAVEVTDTITSHWEHLDLQEVERKAWGKWNVYVHTYMH